MSKGKTKSGFSYTVSDDLGDDIELLEGLTRLDKGEVAVLPDVLRKILGEKQKEKLYEHLRTKDGRVPITSVSEELVEIFTAQGDKAKKS